jgi:hypothetical protein
MDSNNFIKNSSGPWRSGMRAAPLATPALKLFIYPFVGPVTLKTCLSEQGRFFLSVGRVEPKKLRSLTYSKNLLCSLMHFVISREAS